MRLLSITVLLAGLLCVRCVPVQDPASDNADSQSDGAPDQSGSQDPSGPPQRPLGAVARGNAQSGGSASGDAQSSGSSSGNAQSRGSGSGDVQSSGSSSGNAQSSNSGNGNAQSRGSGSGNAQSSGSGSELSRASTVDSNSDDSDQPAPEQRPSVGRLTVTSQKASPSDANPLVAAQGDSVGTLPFKKPGSDAISLEKPDNIASYLQGIRRPGLRMTVDSVDEGYKKKNKNNYQDANINIKNKNSTKFNRNGQVQNFEGPGFNMRTALLTETTDGKTKTLVITQTDKEKNFTRNKDRLTQFVGTLNTDQFSSGALLTDHSNRGVSGSFRQTNDGNRETRINKQSRDNQTRGSFLKAANLSINARYESDSFSNRARQISDIVLGGSDDGSDVSASDSGASTSGATGPGGAPNVQVDDPDTDEVPVQTFG